MVFKTISSSRRRSRWSAGATLVEIVAATAVTSVLSLAVCSGLIYSGRALSGLNNYIDLDDKSRNTLDVMMNGIRAAAAVTSYTTTDLRFVDDSGTAVRFYFDPVAKTLTRTIGAGSTNVIVLLTGCDTLNFKMFQRHPPTGTTTWSSTADVKFCKLIEVSWICSRSLFGTTWNTESVQTAKIVIRNEYSN